MARELIAALQVMEVCRRNRVLFSSVRTANEWISPIGQEFVREIDCVVVPLPPLRARSDTVPSLVSIYLNRINPALDRQIAGITPDGMQMLQEYRWPHNYTQFKGCCKSLRLWQRGQSSAQTR
ncbi:hypothetical protein [Hydrogenoanaerobacterium saccharovorans]|uniref:hypothetical protein n=1 Tax=Hydrogenoanaerobacterium saccharovorans TaxID=474960 RepID=UPI000B862FE0|nr:hypothetical protein [Hydrogenoanaerobacterium saccharovorans]